jgi:hypothetical protein
MQSLKIMKKKIVHNTGTVLDYLKPHKGGLNEIKQWISLLRNLCTITLAQSQVLVGNLKHTSLRKKICSVLNG